MPRDGDAGRLQDDLHEVLVHAQRRIEHSSPGVRDLERVEIPLNRAVLTVRAMQDRQDDVDRAESLDSAVGQHDAQ